jgi:hypothetical protein
LQNACSHPSAVAPASAAEQPAKRYVVVQPGTHPGIVFSAQELPALRKRARSSTMAGDAYRKIRETAVQDWTPPTVHQAAGREGVRLAQQLQSMALVYQVEGDRELGSRAVELFKSIATGIDPAEFYRVVDSDFFATEHWPKAFAFAWDWLFHQMSTDERADVLKGLEQWSAALFAHTERWWWRDASYNCGAIPVGAQGLLVTAIQAETRHPDARRWFSACYRKVKENYFPLTWRDNGICNEGPGYAHYHKNPTQFLEAVRRTGGPDIIRQTGAVNAMHYLRHQWMPDGGCGPVGDNTGYGRRVFQSIYLHGIRELNDAAGLWTFEKHTDFNRIDPVVLFLFYPDDLKPASPGALDLPVSFYFEIDENRAGYLFGRDRWDSEEASWFVFTTRYANANHTHYDMNSFLFTAFGEAFATHADLFPYGHENHGVDFEHNMVIVDEGGMPMADRTTSAGDNGSIRGYMTGVVAGHFADYARGDARMSYADRSVRGSAPATRADRTVLFVKHGPNPYAVIADDIQKDESPHEYQWQWHAPARAISGAGTFEAPFVIDGRNARCALAFVEPATPEHDCRVVKSQSRTHPVELRLLRVNRRAVETRYLAVAAASRKSERPAALRRGPAVAGNAEAASILVEGGGFRDFIVWQPEKAPDAPGARLSAAGLQTDALLAMVRTDGAGELLAYVMGDGSSLEFDGKVLAKSAQRFSVSADARRAMAAGMRRARQGLRPIPATGSVWLPDGATELWVDGVRRPAKTDAAGMALIPAR